MRDIIEAMRTVAEPFALPAPSPAVPPAARLRAGVVDLGRLLGTVAVAAALAALVLLALAGAASVDPGRGVTALVFAVAAAGVPAATGGMAFDLATSGATAGQRRAGIHLEGSRARRLAWFALSPVALPAWAWLAALAALATASTPALLLAAATLIVAVAAAASGVLVLLGGTPIHERLTGTRLVRA